MSRAPWAGSVAALLVVVAGLGGLLWVGELVARDRLQATAADVVQQGLGRTGDDFASVETDVGGWALPALLRGRLSRVDVDATDGTLGGIPVQQADVRATGVRLDGSAAAGLEADLRLDAVAVVAQALPSARLDPAAATSTTVTAPDTLTLALPLDLPLLGAVPVEVDVRVRVVDGGVAAEPVGARAVGLDLPLVDLLPDGMQPVGTYQLSREDLPSGLAVTELTLVQEADGPTALVHLACARSCPLG